MRQIYPVILLLAALAGVSACKVMEEAIPEQVPASEKMYPVHFYSDEIVTKTVFGESETSQAGTSYPTLWSANDSQIAVSLNLKGIRAASVTPSSDFKKADFDAEFPQSEVQAPYTFYALSPYSAAVSASASHGGYHFKVPAEQTPLATSCDESAQVLAASQTAASIDDFQNVELEFTHVTAYGKLTLKNMGNLPADATVRSVELTASAPLAGEFFYNYAGGSWEESASSRTVVINLGNVTVTEGTSGDIWFACAPADLGGGTLKVDVNTSKGVLSRTVQIAAGGLAFHAGRVSKFAVNMAEAVFTPVLDRWVLVTDASALENGDEVIIANSATPGAAYAIRTVENNIVNSREQTVVEITRDADNQIVIENPSSFVEVLKLETDIRAGFLLREGSSSFNLYLYASSAENDNKLLSGTLSAENIDFAHWVISISEGAACISTSGTTTSGNYYKQLRHNASASLFSAYQSSSQTAWDGTTTGTSPVYIFKRGVGLGLDDDPVLQKNTYGAYLIEGEQLYTPSLCQLSREYQGDGTVTFTVIQRITQKTLEFGGIPDNPAKGDRFTLNLAMNDSNGRSDTDYNVIVLKVDGPKVWLSDGSGNGFIVKK